MSTVKLCTKCNITKGSDGFCKNNKTKDGLQTQCKQCRKEYLKANKIRTAKTRKEYYLSNYTDIRQKQKDKYHENIEGERNRSKLYREENKEATAIRLKKYYILNKEKVSLTHKKYNKTINGVMARKNTKHKRRIAERAGDVTTKQLISLQDSAVLCYWCREKLEKKNTHIDHYQPLSKGGEHTLSNLVVSCGDCNMSKNAKSPTKFANSIGRLL